MKSYFTRTVFVAAMLCATLPGFSQIAENFNSRSNLPASQVKSFLQSSCWQFPGFVSNSSTVIEGDGSLVSDTASAQLSEAGIYTPVLNLGSATSLSFSYKLYRAPAASGFIKICVATPYNQVIKVADSIALNSLSAGMVYTYNKSVNTGTDVNKIFIQYTGAARTAPIAIDQLHISAVQHYATGCNSAPVAVPDAFSGGAAGTAVTGNVLQNDRDPDGDQLSAYLISGSAEGTVNLQPNGYFTFTPRPGFNGSTASFSYKVCDNGYSQQCSSTASVLLLFSSGNIVPLRYADFNAAYKNNEVLLNWTTAYENSTETFDIERGSDSIHFSKLGSMRGYGTLGSINFYKYTDVQSAEVNALKDLYYRLKSVDVDKKTIYSPVIKIRIEGVTALRSVKVTPNPVISDIALHLQLNRTCDATVKVMNSTGYVVYSQLLQGAPGMNYLTLKGTAQLQSGLYFVQVLIGKDEKLMSKIIKN